MGWKPRARQQFSASKTRICSSRTVARQFQLKSGMPPIGWKPRAKKQQFQRRQSDSSQQQNSSRAVSNQIGHAPVQLEAATTESREVKVSHVTFNTTHRDSEQHSVSKTSSRLSSSVQKKRDIAAAERWRGSFNSNRTYSRSVESAGPDSSSVQEKQDFAAAKEQQQGNSNSNRACPVGSNSGLDSSSVQTKREFAAAEQSAQAERFFAATEQ